MSTFYRLHLTNLEEQTPFHKKKIFRFLLKNYDFVSITKLIFMIICPRKLFVIKTKLKHNRVKFYNSIYKKIKHKSQKGLM